MGNDLVPEELFSQKNSTEEDAEFNKTLTTDLSRQARQPMTIVSADAANCYDRVNYVTDMANTSQWEHPTNSVSIDMPTDYKILSANRLL